MALPARTCHGSISTNGPDRSTTQSDPTSLLQCLLFGATETGTIVHGVPLQYVHGHQPGRWEIVLFETIRQRSECISQDCGDRFRTMALLDPSFDSIIVPMFRRPTSRLFYPRVHSRCQESIGATSWTVGGGYFVELYRPIGIGH